MTGSIPNQEQLFLRERDFVLKQKKVNQEPHVVVGLTMSGRSIVPSAMQPRTARLVPERRGTILDDLYAAWRANQRVRVEVG